MCIRDRHDVVREAFAGRRAACPAIETRQRLPDSLRGVHAPQHLLDTPIVEQFGHRPYLSHPHVAAHGEPFFGSGRLVRAVGMRQQAAAQTLLGQKAVYRGQRAAHATPVASSQFQEIDLVQFARGLRALEKIFDVVDPVHGQAAAAESRRLARGEAPGHVAARHA